MKHPHVHPLFALVSLAALAACQPAPPAGPGPAPSGSVTPAATPTTSPSPTPVATAMPPAPSPTPERERVLVSGKLLDDNGFRLAGARVEVSSTDAPEINQTLQADGGLYIVPNVPVGITVKLRAVCDGYTPRERTFHVQSLPKDGTFNPNIWDFGGEGKGMFYALSSYPEVSRIDPPNEATDVSGNPLVITFYLSHPLVEQKMRDRFEAMVRIQLPVAGGATETLLKGTTFNKKAAGFTWSADHSVATFRFDAPLVTREAAAVGISVGFDQTVELLQWPEAANGKPLGRERLASAFAGNGGTVSNVVAPFLGDLTKISVPTVRPSPDVMWSLAHRTTSTFSFASKGVPAKIVKVATARGLSGQDDLFYVTFDRPMSGFPLAALDGSAIAASSYRAVIGNTAEEKDRDAFAKADPAAGKVPTKAASYDPDDPNTVIVAFPSGTFAGGTVYKLYVAPSVKDVTGTPISVGTPDPQTGRSDNVFQGNL